MNFHQCCVGKPNIQVKHEIWLPLLISIDGRSKFGQGKRLAGIKLQ